MYEYSAEVRLLKALTHPVRLAILDILREGEQCVCHIEAILGQRQAYISQQLIVLREAGLVEDRRDGWNIFYHVSRPEVFDVLDAFRHAVGTPTAKLVSTSAACTCPNCKERHDHPVELPVQTQSER